MDFIIKDIINGSGSNKIIYINSGTFNYTFICGEGTEPNSYKNAAFSLIGFIFLFLYFLFIFFIYLVYLALYMIFIILYLLFICTKYISSVSSVKADDIIKYPRYNQVSIFFFFFFFLCFIKCS
jgi:Ca2+/Na+ antiporter